MKSILERALVHLLNEENDKAEELLHQYVIEQARGIHETLREDDDIDADIDADLDLEEAVFTEADLDFGEDETDDAVAELGDDLGEEIPVEADGEDFGDDDLASDDDSVEPAEENIDDELASFEQELSELQAKFDELLAGIDDDSSEEVGDDEMSDEEEVGDDMAEVSDEDDFSSEDFGSDEDDFDDITESVISELQAVTADRTTEGKGTDGSTTTVNADSLKFRVNSKASPAKSTGGEHHGFDRETAPTSTALKGSKTVVSQKMKNTRPSADPKVTPPATQGKAAILKKAPAPNDKSPIKPVK